MAGTTVIVTGAASGIGAAVVRRLHQAGTNVVGQDLDTGPLAELERSAGKAFVGVGGDVSNERDVADAVTLCVERFGRLDGYVAAAGVGTSGTVEELSVEAWDRIFAANVRSVFMGAKYAFPSMRRGGGSFVAVASQHGLVGERASAAYTASKAAVVNLVRSMALDVAGDGIRVNAVCPGPVDTPMLQRSFRAGLSSAEALARVPLGRFGTPREIADVISFLLSDQSAFVTGAAWVADGGYTAQ